MIIRPGAIMALLAGAFLVTACHNDPFSIKPETNAQLPEKPPVSAQPGDAEPDAEETATPDSPSQ